MTRMELIEALSGFPFYGYLHRLTQGVKLKRWKADGCPVPPPHVVKQSILKRLAGENNLSTLVETGTHLGDMVYAMRCVFTKIYSIELSTKFYAMAVKRFRKFSHVKIKNGDSGVVLHELIQDLTEPTLFWLDGHFSGGATALGDEFTPIFKELDAVFSLPNRYVVAIDDARLFGTDPGYPSMDKLLDYVRNKNEALNIYVEHDVVVIQSR